MSADNILLPFDIQTEIIKRAPVKSIIRFRLVSKTWRSFIDSSGFISGYRKSSSSSLQLLRYKHKSDCSVKYVSVVNDGDTFTQQDLTPNVSALMKQITFQRFIGCSRGLLCVYAPLLKGGMLVLWNPAIRRSVGILGFPSLHCLFGFSVSPITNEPTIVRISNSPWKLEVFTLTSKKWTLIQCSKPPREFVLLYGKSSVVTHNCIYRVTYQTQDDCFTKQYMIVSFDLDAKEFKAIDLPDMITSPFSEEPISFFISKLKGSLVVIVPPGDSSSEIKVWKMEIDSSFAQLFTINTSCITHIAGFRKNGELVVETRETPGESVSFGGGIGTFEDTHSHSALAVYDPCSKQITNLGISGRDGSFFVNSYKETLLLLDHLDSCEYPEIN